MPDKQRMGRTGPAPHDRSAHSDFLIHWTGRDIEIDAGTEHWAEQEASELEEPAVSRYLKRLSDILEYGLWMTEDDSKNYKVGSLEFTIPNTPHCCFTELRLSEARRHASRFGRLGVGVKRPFAYERGGRPVIYFNELGSMNRDDFLEEYLRGIDKSQASDFLKSMAGRGHLRGYDYTTFDESEWRIVSKFADDKYIIDPINTDIEKYKL